MLASRDVLTLAADVFGVPPERLSLETTYQSISEWDSIAHLRLMTEVGARFGTEIEFSEVTQVTSLWELSRRLNGGAIKKAVAVDFDNTLWHGIVCEDGPDGIVPDLVFQRELKSLKDRGILLVGLSKNDEQEALAGLYVSERMGGLSPDDFVALKVNWQPKSKNLQDVAAELGLGLDAFVFIDDRASERLEMSLTLPDVTVAEFPPKVEAYFPPRTLTEEDRRRTEEYRAEAKRREVVGGLPEGEGLSRRIFEMLDVKLDIHAMNESEVPRVVQLSQKANQFNVCTNRLVEESVKALAGTGLILVAKMRDRFGDRGLVAFAILEGDEVRDWVMSCRVAGCGLEERLGAALVAEASSRGINVLKAKWHASGKNEPVRELFDRIGFNLLAMTESERRYERVLG